MFKRLWVATCGLAGLAGIGWSVVWLTDAGDTSHLVPAPEDKNPPAKVAAGDPAASGNYEVIATSYGSGVDRHREAFGPGVKIKTDPINLKPYASFPGGWRGDLRKEFWGFDTSAVPLNARVWRPAGRGPFPLVLIVHGNHNMAEFSDPGYAYLGRLLASRGFIACSIDENFVNGGGPAHGNVKRENDARAIVLLEHLKLWRKWNTTAGHPMEGIADLDKIVLVGHSRGGEAVGHAALFNRLPCYPDDASVRFDYGFHIRGIVAIAPSDGQYKPSGRETVVDDIAYLVVQGGHDADVSSFYGDRFYRRVRFTKPGPAFKASLWAYRANHGQFNSVWGANDVSPPRAWLLNHAALLPAAEQRKIAEVYISAFVELTLHGAEAYRALFQDYRTGRDWLPHGRILVSRYEDPSFRLVTDFEEDFDVTTTSLPGGRLAARGLVVWRESDIAFRGGSRRYDTGAVLGWKNEVPTAENKVSVTEAVHKQRSWPTYELTLPDGFEVAANEQLVFDMAASNAKPKAKDYGPKPAAANDSDEKDTEDTDHDKPSQPLDLSVELTDAAGTTVRLPLHRFGILEAPLLSKLTRVDALERRYRSSFEAVPQRFALPMAAFQAENPKFDPTKLHAIRWVFDQSQKGVVILDRVGFTR